MLQWESSCMYNTCYSFERFPLDIVLGVGLWVKVNECFYNRWYVLPYCFPKWSFQFATLSVMCVPISTEHCQWCMLAFPPPQTANLGSIKQDLSVAWICIDWLSSQGAHFLCYRRLLLDTHYVPGSVLSAPRATKMPSKTRSLSSRSSWSNRGIYTNGSEGRSRCGSAVTNTTSIYEDAGLTPGLTQWLKDLALPWAMM